MKKLFPLFFLFVAVLAAGTFRAAAITQDEASGTPAETWQTVTKANNNQFITVHLNQKLVVQIQEKKRWNQDADFSHSLGDENLLKFESEGELNTASTDALSSYLWVFQPTAVGETTLTFKQNYWFSSEDYINVTIDIVE